MKLNYRIAGMAAVKLEYVQASAVAWGPSRLTRL